MHTFESCGPLHVLYFHFEATRNFFNHVALRRRIVGRGILDRAMAGFVLLEFVSDLHPTPRLILIVQVEICFPIDALAPTVGENRLWEMLLATVDVRRSISQLSVVGVAAAGVCRCHCFSVVTSLPPELLASMVFFRSSADLAPSTFP